MSDMLPRLVRADRLSTLFTPVASKVVLSVAVYVDRFGKLSVAPPSAYRLELFTSVKPGSEYEPSVIVRMPPPVRLDHWLVATVPLAIKGDLDIGEAGQAAR